MFLPLQASPPSLCPHGRTRDLDAVLAVMGGAGEFIYVSVMEYFPTTRFTHPARWVWVRSTLLIGKSQTQRPCT